MNDDSTKHPRGRRASVVSALPEDDDALAGLAAAAFGGQSRAGGPAGRGTLSAVPVTAPAETTPAAATSRADSSPAVPASAASATQPAGHAGPAADSAPATAPDPEADPSRDFIRQATIQVDAQIVTRFREYQRREANRNKGVRPSNLDVVFAALSAADGREKDIVASHRPHVPEGQRWGRPLPGRRTGGSRLSSQINYRPSVGELADITQLAAKSGADSVSAFLNMVLDDFLPAAGSRTAQRP